MPLPRPPAWICDFTTTIFSPAANSFSAAARAAAPLSPPSVEDYVLSLHALTSEAP